MPNLAVIRASRRGKGQVMYHTCIYARVVLASATMLTQRMEDACSLHAVRCQPIFRNGHVILRSWRPWQFASSPRRVVLDSPHNSTYTTGTFLKLAPYISLYKLLLEVDGRRKTFRIAMETLSSKNVQEVVMLLKKELRKTVDEQYEKNAEYRQ